MSVTLSAAELRRLMHDTFVGAGIPAERAAIGSDILLWASLRGVDTHGVRNLRPLYIRFIEDGRLDPLAVPGIEYETPMSIRANGHNGFGLYAAHWAMQQAIERAQQSGLGIVSMHNSNHLGAAGYYAAMAAEAGLVGASMTAYFLAEDAEVGVLPIHGKRPMLATNPLAISFPTETEVPFLLDMATSVVPYNRIAMLRDAGLPIPLGWGLDGEGNPTTDPGQLKQLLPLGGTRELGGHKGYSLSLMVEVLCALLSGGWNEAEAAPPATSGGGRKQHNFAHFFAALRVDLLRPLTDFKRDMDDLIRTVHSREPAAGHDRIRVPGEIEHHTALQREANGIPLSETVVADLQTMAADLGVRLPPALRA